MFESAYDQSKPTYMYPSQYQFSFIIRILRQKEDAKKEFKHKYKFSDQSIGTKLTLHDKLELSKTVKKSQ